MVHRSSGTPDNWQEHVDGKPTYNPVIPPKAPNRFTGGLYLKGNTANCLDFFTSEQEKHSEYVHTVAPNGAGTTSGMLGYMFWAAETPSARKRPFRRALQKALGSTDRFTLSPSGEGFYLDLVSILWRNWPGYDHGPYDHPYHPELLWAAETPSARKNYKPTVPPNTCEGGMGVAANQFNIPIPMPPLRQH